MARKTRQENAEEQAKPLEACPVCGGTLRAVPTRDVDERWSEVPAVDARLKASQQQKEADFGALQRCDVCGYQTRVKAEAA